LAIAESIPRVISETPNLTSRESEILCLETLRQVGIDDIPASKFDQVAQAAGTSGPKLRAHVEDYDENGHLSASDRKALSRARAKVLKVLTRAKLVSLLVIVFALSLALYKGIHQGRSSHQNDFVKQSCFSHQSARADFSHQSARADQVGLVATNHDSRG
jgi:hypothetical protein